MPYTAFTYGDAAAIDKDPSSNPYITSVTRTLISGVQIGSSGAAPVLLGSVLAGGTTGTAYSETVSVIGGTAPYAFSVGGALPTGLSFNSSTLVISGTPTTVGTYSFTITVTDANNNTSTESFSITISTPSTGGVSNYSYVA